ncbi:hypothetical protein L7F22_054308 [Adiantum nelumboides]|nr:hypothetical protein [Adiantum nelumboides]
MSLLRKIRRRHKAFGLKTSKQTTTVDQAPSVSSVEDGDEDDDVVGIIGMQGTPIVKTSAQPEDVSEKSSPHATKGDVFGRRSHFWPRIATTGILLLLSLGAFYVGKLVTVGITLCILLACKLSARHCVVSSNHSQADKRGESVPVSPKNRKFDGNELDESPFESFIVNDDNNGEMDVEVNSHNKDEDTFSGEGSLSTKRKQLKRQGLLEHDVMLGVALVDMYAKCGALRQAQSSLEKLPSHNVVSWSALNVTSSLGVNDTTSIADAIELELITTAAVGNGDVDTVVFTIAVKLSLNGSLRQVVMQTS